MMFNWRTTITHETFGAWSRYLYARARHEIRRYRDRQIALAVRYKLDGTEPADYCESTRKRIRRIADARQEPGRYAWTSGTLGEPKRIFYPASRIRRLQRTCMAQMVLAARQLGIRRPVFQILANLEQDGSLSSTLAQVPPPWFVQECLLRTSVSYVPSLARHASRYSTESIYLALLLVTGPSMVVTVNPSSLFVLLKRAQERWEVIRGELKALLNEDWLAEIRRRLGPEVDGRVARARERIAQPRPPMAREIMPETEAIYCWDGGYVGPFLDSLRAAFGRPDPRFAPMFSLSTETVAYEIYPELSTEGGFPIHPGVCYEFLPENGNPVETKLLKPWDLEPGNAYQMIVSDAYGLKRYLTGDLFDCRGRRDAVPILTFRGRTGVNYSFTGEKLTGEQLVRAYADIRSQTGDSALFTCFPSRRYGEVPGYVIVRCSCGWGGGSAIANALDQRLIAMNGEYAAKRRSGRLVAPILKELDFGALVAKLRCVTSVRNDTAAAQFKFLPLYSVLWEDVMASTGKEDDRPARTRSSIEVVSS